jgi:chloramphenicol 3-O phosphotransferase
MTLRIIILNGVGSAGKSSIARALQEVTAEPFLHVAMDAFLDMLPASHEGHPDGLTFETVRQNGEPAVAIRSGKVVERTLRGMRRAIAALAAEGNNLIIDDVMLDAEMDDYRALLKEFEVFFVGVFAPLAILEERERQRQDRMLGLARWQYDLVHAGKTYDLEIDTSDAAPMACARKIKEAFGL